MADVFDADPDYVLALAGHREPSEPLREGDPKTQIISLVKRVRLTEDRAVGLESTLRGWIDLDRSHRKVGGQSS